MTGLHRRCSVIIASAIVAAAATASAQEVVGTLTINGKTTLLKHAAATIETDPARPTEEYLVLLVSDVPVAAADRTPARLLDLAKSRRLHAVRILWLTVADWVRAVPYDPGVPESGRQAVEHPTIDLRVFDGRRVEVDVKSKMMGQAWHFHAFIKAPLVKTKEPIAIEEEAQELHRIAEAPEGSTGTDPVSLKRRLGGLGYEFTPEMFTHAVKDGRLDAVQLFLQLGTSPNTRDSIGNHMLLISAMMCTREPTDHRTDILKALIAAGGNANAQDMNKSTPLIWAAQSCDEAFIQTLIKAGANVNAKAAGGGTPLIMATAMGRPDIVEILKRAGAR